MDNAQCRLLTIQHPHDGKCREKKDLENKENSIEQVDSSMSDSSLPLHDIRSGDGQDHVHDQKMGCFQKIHVSPRINQGAGWGSVDLQILLCVYFK